MTPTPAPWATPTYIAIPVGTPVFDLGGVQYQFAEQLVQGYQVANNTGSMDTIYTVLIVIVVVLGFLSIIGRIAKLKGNS